jgi:hypothetical protein
VSQEIAAVCPQEDKKKEEQPQKAKHLQLKLPHIDPF